MISDSEGKTPLFAEIGMELTDSGLYLRLVHFTETGKRDRRRRGRIQPSNHQSNQLGCQVTNPGSWDLLLNSYYSRNHK